MYVLWLINNCLKFESKFLVILTGLGAKVCLLT